MSITHKSKRHHFYYLLLKNVRTATQGCPYKDTLLILCRGEPMCSPVCFLIPFIILIIKRKIWVKDIPCEERIKVRGNNYIVDCWLLIADWKNKKQPTTSNVLSNQQAAITNQQCNYKFYISHFTSYILYRKYFIFYLNITYPHFSNLSSTSLSHHLYFMILLSPVLLFIITLKFNSLFRSEQRQPIIKLCQGICDSII